jgi:hypothetical protein
MTVERTPTRPIRPRTRSSTIDGHPERPRVRVLTPRNSPFESNRSRLGLPAANKKRIREELEYQDALAQSDYAENISDDPRHPNFYDPFAWDRIDNA